MKVKNFNKIRNQGSEFAISRDVKDTLKNSYGLLQIKILKILLIISCFIILSTLIFLQIIKAANYQKMAELNSIRRQEIKPLRGVIFDQNQQELVKNKANFTLMARPFDLYQKKEIKQEIINFLIQKNLDKKTIQEIKEKLTNYSYLPIILKKNIPYEQGIKLIPKITNWPGVFLQESFQREYLYPECSHVLGYTGFVNQDDLKQSNFYSISDIKGQAGIELSYEKQLRGIKGEKKIQVDSLGRENKILNLTPSQKGQDIILNLDLKIQQELTKILKEQMEFFDVKKSAAIVLNPQNGAIIALISLPSFDNNLFTLNFNQEDYQKLLENPNQPLFNRGIAGEYPPGSTFKLIVGAAALEEKLIDQYFTVNSTGGIRIGEWFFPDWQPQGHGRINIVEALAWSVNTYFYTIGGGYKKTTGLGLEKITKYAKMFNIGSLSNIDINGEKAGFVPSKEWKLSYKNEPWYLGDTYHLAIGQGDILATPLQVALWTSFFANQGTLYQPQIKKNPPKIINQNFITQENIEIIRQGLRQAVLTGSASSLASLSVKSAGKTGSAQFSKNKKPHGWFTGFAPFQNPELVITVLMEQGGGAKSAVAVARNFLDWYFKELDA